MSKHRQGLKRGSIMATGGLAMIVDTRSRIVRLHESKKTKSSDRFEFRGESLVLKIIDNAYCPLIVMLLRDKSKA